MAAALSTLLLLALWWGVASRTTDGIDAALRDAVHSLAAPAVTTAIRGITVLGGNPFQTLLGAAVCLHLWKTGRRSAALLLAISAVGGQLCSEALKLAFQRARPEAWFGYPLPSSYSFPSGHAVAAATFYGVLAAIVSPTVRRRPARVLLWTAAATLTLLIGISRIYLGVHYPTDVVAGYAVAVIWVAAVHTVAKTLRQRRVASNT